MNRDYRSHAKWTKISESNDIHNNERSAQSICELLIERHGTDLTSECSIRGKCTEAWTTIDGIKQGESITILNRWF